MFVSVVILSLALYVTLTPVNKNLALLALFWRLGEAILGGVAVLSSLIVLLLLNGKDYIDCLFLFIFKVEVHSQNIGRLGDIFIFASANRHFHKYALAQQRIYGIQCTGHSF